MQKRKRVTSTIGISSQIDVFMKQNLILSHQILILLYSWWLFIIPGFGWSHTPISSLSTKLPPTNHNLEQFCVPRCKALDRKSRCISLWEHTSKWVWNLGHKKCQVYCQVCECEVYSSMRSLVAGQNQFSFRGMPRKTLSKSYNVIRYSAVCTIIVHSV